MSGEKGQNRIRLALKIILPIACVLWLTFILTNSLQTGERSTTQSATVVGMVQKVAQVIAPKSEIANATGEKYDLLHAMIRNMAHFMQYAVLGALLGWCYFAYTFKLRYIGFPIFLVVLIPLIDEWIQSFVAGRGSELADVLTDTYGGLAGIAIACLSVLIGVIFYRIKTRKKENDDAPKMPKDHPMYGLK